MAYLTLPLCGITRVPVEDQVKPKLLHGDEKAAFITDLVVATLVAMIGACTLLHIHGFINLGSLSCIGIIGPKAAYIMIGTGGGCIVLNLAKLMIQQARHLSKLYRLKNSLQEARRVSSQMPTQANQQIERLTLDNQQLDAQLAATRQTNSALQNENFGLEQDRNEIKRQYQELEVANQQLERDKWLGATKRSAEIEKYKKAWSEAKREFEQIIEKQTALNVEMTEESEELGKQIEESKSKIEALEKSNQELRSALTQSLPLPINLEDLPPPPPPVDAPPPFQPAGLSSSVPNPPPLPERQPLVAQNDSESSSSSSSTTALPIHSPPSSPLTRDPLLSSAITPQLLGEAIKLMEKMNDPNLKPPRMKHADRDYILTLAQLPHGSSMVNRALDDFQAYLEEKEDNIEKDIYQTKVTNQFEEAVGEAIGNLPNEDLLENRQLDDSLENNSFTGLFSPPVTPVEENSLEEDSLSIDSSDDLHFGSTDSDLADGAISPQALLDKSFIAKQDDGVDPKVIVYFDSLYEWIKEEENPEKKKVRVVAAKEQLQIELVNYMEAQSQKRTEEKQKQQVEEAQRARELASKAQADLADDQQRRIDQALTYAPNQQDQYDLRTVNLDSLTSNQKAQIFGEIKFGSQEETIAHLMELQANLVEKAEGIDVQVGQEEALGELEELAETYSGYVRTIYNTLKIDTFMQKKAD